MYDELKELINNKLMIPSINGPATVKLEDQLWTVKESQGDIKLFKVKLEYNGYPLFFKDYKFEPSKSEDLIIQNIKKRAFAEILMFLLYMKLPMWKEINDSYSVDGRYK